MKSLSPRKTGGSDPAPEFQELIDEALEIRRDLIELTNESLDLLEQVHSSQRESAVNLLHYVALRSRDLRPLQMRLATRRPVVPRARRIARPVLQLTPCLRSSTGRSDAHWQPEEPDEPRVDLERGQHLLGAHTHALLGSVPADRGVAIMVTMPSEAAIDYSLVQHLLEHGMDCMRINCAHDDEAAWARMIEHLRRAEQATGRPVACSWIWPGPSSAPARSSQVRASSRSGRRATCSDASPAPRAFGSLRRRRRANRRPRPMPASSSRKRF